MATTSGTVGSIILDPSMASESILRSGINKARLPRVKMIILGFLAGMYLSLGGQIMFQVLVGSSGSGAEKFLAGSSFSIGLCMIVIAGAELFTGNCLLLVAVLAKRIKVKEMLHDWVIVYFSNFLGSIVMALIVFGSDINGYNAAVLTGPGGSACRVAAAKGDLEAHKSFLRGIGANFLVCVAIIMSSAAKSATGKILSIWLPIAMFITIGFEHSIANMYVFAMGTLLNCPQEGGHGRYWLNLLMCTLGNILGASILAVSYWLVYVHDTPLEGTSPLLGASLPKLAVGKEEKEKKPTAHGDSNEPLSVTLADLPNEEQKNVLGERLFAIVRETHPSADAAKVTGTMLELDNSELVRLLEEHPAELNVRIAQVIGDL